MIDLAAVAVAFGAALHEDGLAVTPERSGRFARAIQLVNPLTTTELYWVARITFLTRHEDLTAFERVFDQVFRGLVDIAGRRGDPASPPVHSRPAARPPTAAGRSPEWTGPGTGGVSAATPRSLSHRAAEGAADPRREAAVGMFSREERLATTDFGALDPRELVELQALMRLLRVSPPLRRGRRFRRHHHGDRLDVRATLRRSHRTGGDPVVQMRKRRPPRFRRLVVLCDISGSMEPYSRAYVQFLHATVGASRAEVFTFATRLTRLTKALALPEPERAIARASEAAPDWRGGTRIGDSLKSFVDTYGRRGMARGAVVVIVSDGWELGDPALLGEQMARLRRLAHRIVWVNPRTADGRFQPLAGGMAAALPYCDALVSGHTVMALSDVVASIASPSRSRNPVTPDERTSRNQLRWSMR